MYEWAATWRQQYRGCAVLAEHLLRWDRQSDLRLSSSYLSASDLASSDVMTAWHSRHCCMNTLAAPVCVCEGHACGVNSLSLWCALLQNALRASHRIV